MNSNTKNALIDFIKAQRNFNTTVAGELFIGTPEPARAVMVAADSAVFALEKEQPPVPPTATTANPAA